MKAIFNIALSILALYILAQAGICQTGFAFSLELSSKPTEFVGTRTLYGLKIPWYKFEVDYNAFNNALYNTIKKGQIWKEIKVPSGTKTAYVGYYGDIEFPAWDGDEHLLLCAKGFNFMCADGYKYKVGPGPGTILMEDFFYEEKESLDTMSFKDDRYYVFCLDSQPEKRGLTFDKKPSCDMDTELHHIIAIIEIQRTFDFENNKKSPVFSLSMENMISYREERHLSSYELEFSIERKDNNLFVYKTGTPERRFVIRPETMQKLLYAYNTRIWKKLKEPISFEYPAIVRTIIEYIDEDRIQRKVQLDWYEGEWYMKQPDNKYYKTTFPLLIHEVEKEIETTGTHYSKEP